MLASKDKSNQQFASVVKNIISIISELPQIE